MREGTARKLEPALDITVLPPILLLDLGIALFVEIDNLA